MWSQSLRYSLTSPLQKKSLLAAHTDRLKVKGWKKKNTQLTQIKAGKEDPGSPAAKTSPSRAGDAGSIPGWGAQIPLVPQSENQNTKQAML